MSVSRVVCVCESCVYVCVSVTRMCCARACVLNVCARVYKFCVYTSDKH